MHQTPLGAMPGALVHANLINSLVHFGAEERESRIAKIAFEFVLLVVGAVLVTVLYWSAVELVHDWKRKARRGRMLEFAIFVSDIVWFVIISLLVSVVITSIMAMVGARMLFNGIIVGSLIPVFALVVEALVHIGHQLYEWLHVAARWVVDQMIRLRQGKPSNVAVALLLVCVPPTAAKAQPLEAVGYLRVERGVARNVVIQRPGGKNISGNRVYDVFPKDTILVIDTTTIAKIYVYGVGPKPEEGIVQGHPYVVENIALPPQDMPLYHSLKELWDALVGHRPPSKPEIGATEAMTPTYVAPSDGTTTTATANASRSHREPSEGEGGTVIANASRSHSEPSEGEGGAVATNAAPEGSVMAGTSRVPTRMRAVPLRAIPLLDSRRFRIAQNASSVLVMWSGGIGPFLVVWNGGPGEAFSVRVSNRTVLLPVEFAKAGDEHVVRITDIGQVPQGATAQHQGGSLEIDLVAVSVDAVPRRPTRGSALDLPAAAWLIEHAPPEWRLEGVRQIQQLASGGNSEATAVLAELEASFDTLSMAPRYELTHDRP